MARVRANADIGSRDARRRLKARREPYFFVIERGLSLGYRKSQEGGTWVAGAAGAARRRAAARGPARAPERRGRRIGTFAIQVAKARGARVTAVACARNQDLLRELGADECLDYAKEDFARREAAFDVVFDIVP